MATKKPGARATRSAPTFPVLMPAEIYTAANKRADELYMVPTRYFQGCVRQLTEFQIPQEVIDAALKVRKEKSAHGEAGEKKSWNFELDAETRDQGHAAARALGFTLSAYLIACAEMLARTPDPPYLKAPVTFLRAKLKKARKEAAQANGNGGGA